MAIGAIVGRACHPASERETHRWLQDHTGLGELIGYDFEKLSLHKIYPIADQLLKNQSAIEKHLYQKERNIFEKFLGFLTPKKLAIKLIASGSV